VTDAARIDADLVRRLVAGQFPEWAGLPVTPVAKAGWDNDTYRLGDALTVRLPRYERWIGQVEREQTWLPRLAPQLPLAVPEPVAQGEPAEGYPYPWSVLRWLDGEPATTAALPDPRRVALDLAAFLAALQRIDADGGPPPQWSNGFRGCALDDPRDSPVVASRIAGMIAALDGVVDTAPISAAWEAALAAPPWDGPPVWVHGDPAPGNLLVRDGRLAAVIDFGTLAVGDPAVDLIAAWQFVAPEACAEFRAALGVDDATWARGRGWAVSVALIALPYYRDTNPALVAQSWRTLRELLAG